MKLGELMNRLNNVWVGNEDKLKDVRVRLSGAGCLFELEDIAPDYESMSLVLGDEEYIKCIWPKLYKDRKSDTELQIHLMKNEEIDKILKEGKTLKLNEDNEKQ